MISYQHQNSISDSPDHGAPLAPTSPTAPSTTAVLEREEQKQHFDGDHDRFAHYVSKEKMAKAAKTGSAVIALCGKMWVPGKDPSKYPICPKCKEIYEELSDGSSQGNSHKGRGGFGGFFGGRGK